MYICLNLTSLTNNKVFSTQLCKVKVCFSLESGTSSSEVGKAWAVGTVTGVNHQIWRGDFSTKLIKFSSLPYKSEYFVEQINSQWNIWWDYAEFGLWFTGKFQVPSKYGHGGHLIQGPWQGIQTGESQSFHIIWLRFRDTSLTCSRIGSREVKVV